MSSRYATQCKWCIRLALRLTRSKYAPPRTRKVLVIAVVAVVLLAFFAFAYGACRASDSVVPPPAAYVPRVLSNGTHDFAPTTILISLDGFRADFLHRNITPNLKKMMQQGTSPRYMLPSFPSLTFPNHFTLVTGMYPESHGIVGNNFYDPVMQKQFTYANKELSMKPEYWNAEPVSAGNAMLGPHQLTRIAAMGDCRTKRGPHCDTHVARQRSSYRQTGANLCRQVQQC